VLVLAGGFGRMLTKVGFNSGIKHRRIDEVHVVDLALAVHIISTKERLVLQIL